MAVIFALAILVALTSDARAEPGHQSIGLTCIDVQYVLATKSWKTIDSIVARMTGDEKRQAMQCLTRSQQAKLRARYGK